MFDFVLLPTVAVLAVEHHLTGNPVNDVYPTVSGDVPLPPAPK